MSFIAYISWQDHHGEGESLLVRPDGGMSFIAYISWQDHHGEGESLLVRPDGGMSFLAYISMPTGLVLVLLSNYVWLRALT